MKNVSFFLVVFIVIGLASPSDAYEFKLGQSAWALGGSARLDAYWDHKNLGDVTPGQASSETQFLLEVPTDTNINVAVEYGKVSGYAEVGLTNVLSSVDASLDTLLEIRQLFLAYDFGSGHSLLVGKVPTCFSEAAPDQRLYNDNGMQGFGDLSSSRHVQIRYRYTHERWLLQAALEQAKTDDPDEILGLPEEAANAYIVDAYIPALVLSLGYNGDTFHITPSVYIQTYELKKNAQSSTEVPLKDITVNTYGVCLNGDMKITDLTLSGEAWWGQNLSIFDLDLRDRDASSVFGQHAAAATDSIRNVKSYGGWLQAAVQTGNGIARVGSGYQRAETKLHGESVEDFISTWGAFVNFQWSISEALSITPEVVYFNLGKDADKEYSSEGNSLGSEFMAGVHLQYDF